MKEIKFLGKWLLNHKVISLTGLFLVVGMPLIINGVFKKPATFEILRAGAEWNEGVILGYYGSVISFIGTVLLGGLSLYQNELYRKENNKLNEKLDMEQKESKRPILAFESHNGLQFKLKNITKEVAYNFGVGSATLQLGNTRYLLFAEQKDKSSLAQNEEKMISFKPATELKEYKDLVILNLTFQYNDIFRYNVLDEYAIAFNLNGDNYSCSTLFEKRTVRSNEKQLKR
ncbi:hypothetical protein [Lacrimispora sp.]|uniref:hypothetical protein n=1 Tax=Lacrimispora sp. TaxID=2719234 RepID=UPI0028AEE7CA|nr:hypothetical protein [Lacrimispora sp.]